MKSLCHALVVSVFLSALGAISQAQAADEGACDEAFDFLQDYGAQMTPEQAWHGVACLKRLYEKEAKKETRELVEGLGDLIDGTTDETRRTMLAYACGFMGEGADAQAKRLGKLLEEDPSPAVRLACALSLARMGKKGVKQSLDVVESGSLIGGGLACGAVRAAGPSSSSTRKALGSALKSSNFRAVLLSFSVLSVLEEGDPKALEGAHKNRERALAKMKLPPVEGFNWGGLVPVAPEEILRTLRTLVASEVPVEEFALPETLPPEFNGRLFEGVGCLARSTADGVCELALLLLQPEFPSWESYSAAARPWERTLELLQQVEDGWIP